MDELTLQVSGINVKDGKKQAFVRFTDKDRFAEGSIPDCVITKSEGFTKEETAQLESYLKSNLSELKKASAKINPLNAIMGI